LVVQEPDADIAHALPAATPKGDTGGLSRSGVCLIGELAVAQGNRDAGVIATIQVTRQNRRAGLRLLLLKSGFAAVDVGKTRRGAANHYLIGLLDGRFARHRNVLNHLFPIVPVLHIFNLFSLKDVADDKDVVDPNAERGVFVLLDLYAELADLVPLEGFRHLHALLGVPKDAALAEIHERDAYKCPILCDTAVVVDRETHDGLLAVAVFVVDERRPSDLGAVVALNPKLQRAGGEVGGEVVHHIV